MRGKGKFRRMRNTEASRLWHRSGGSPARHAVHASAAALLLVFSTLVGALVGLNKAAAQDLIREGGQQPIRLMVGQGRTLHFDGPASNVFIADSSIADVNVIAPDLVYLYGKKSGTTNLVVLSADRRVTGTVQFQVGTDPRPANDALRSLRTTSNIDISIFGRRAAVAGRAHMIEEAVNAENLAETYSPEGQSPINSTTIDGSQQINIRVRFAEISRNALLAFGFNWKVLGGAEAGSVGFGGSVNISVLLEALERQGMLTVLAEPNLTAVTGQPASFLAGGEVPVPTPQPYGGAPTVEYKPFGISLEFTPTIIATNRIALHVRPQVSTISEVGAIKISGTELPSFMVRRADTTVEVASGQTFAIGGLFQRQLLHDIDKLPGLGDVPVLGQLFTSDRYRRDESELVILITPYLVRPTRNPRMATPIDRPVPPSTSPEHAEKSAGFIFK
jgi:pilus assembly protein CpaC